VDADSERAKELLGERPRRDPRRRLARTGSLEDVAHVAMAVLEDAGQVRVPGPWKVNLLDFGVYRPRVHALVPVLVIAVCDQHRDRASEGTTVAHPGADLDRVALDLHPPPAPVAELAARHFAVERLAIKLQPRGQTLDDRHEPGPVRLAGGYEPKRHGTRLVPRGEASRRVPAS
jgi:hypothetical protein